VVVLCRHAAGTDASTHPRSDRVVEGVRIIRVAEDPMHLTFERDLVAWTLAMGHAMIRAAHDVLRTWQPDVVHAHDWLVTHPAIAVAEVARVPLVGTVHATEAGNRIAAQRKVSQQNAVPARIDGMRSSHSDVPRCRHRCSTRIRRGGWERVRLTV
jgi:hypothetical protein